MSEIKKMSPKEFRKLGYLQEVNRQFLHPLGLALEMVIDDESGGESFGSVWDYRNDPEGIKYDLENSDQSRIDSFQEKADYVASEKARILESRTKTLGFDVEPIKGKDVEQDNWCIW